MYGNPQKYLYLVIDWFCYLLYVRFLLIWARALAVTCLYNMSIIIIN